VQRAIETLLQRRGNILVLRRDLGIGRAGREQALGQSRGASPIIAHAPRATGCSAAPDMDAARRRELHQFVENRAISRWIPVGRQAHDLYRRREVEPEVQRDRE